MIEVVDTRLVAKVTGRESINETDRRYGVHGTDLGIMWDDDRGRTLVAFGDTYGEGWCGNGAGPREADWRYNFLAFADDRDLATGLRLSSVVTRPDGHARQILDRGSSRREETVIPCSGVSIDGKHYLQYMSVRGWEGPVGWWTNYGGIAVSHDGGYTWDKPADARWVNRRRHDNPFQLGAFAREGDYLYLLGVPNGRWGDACLARVAPTDVLNRRAYEYWTGATWYPRDEFRAVPVMRGPIGELSVLYSVYFGRWLAVHLNETLAALVLRTAEHLTGPWSEPVVLVSGKDYPALYGGFLHPASADGPDIHYTMSQWGPYNVFLMHSRLTRSPGGTS
ncbi:DUF4185 domain-containing protein [Actinokineospora auranticolor]|uniref:Uncharacterized protein DUF4185 n=1 Tax=Actinokineospora auranticolor TaxID=155976 RepID=A0A2S6GYP1_9PSEU|nr:DUF4185 domain-containing protein [Actinokineospora auranticolor]PPK70355.1 uncharacterized protein DUF4185 [Actinokineospora auranticolor]